MIKTKDGFLINNLTAKVGDVIDGKVIIKVLGQTAFPIVKNRMIVNVKMLEVAFKAESQPVTNNTIISDDIAGFDNLGDDVPQEPADWQNLFQDN